jgi:hypothetical protein
MKFAKNLFLASVLLATIPAYAVTECPVRLTSIFSGDEGYVWFMFDNGGSAYLAPLDKDLKNTLALGMLALAADKIVTIRYATDNVACNSSARSDLTGMFIYK